MASNLNNLNKLSVRQAEIDLSLAYENMSPVGKMLHDIANEIAQSDDPAASEQEIEKELRERRGGHSHDDEDSYVH